MLLVDDNDKKKICARCKQELSIDNFYICRSGKINSYCKVCDRERKKNIKPIEPPKDLNFYKVCSCCGKKKLATEFHKHSRRKDGLSTQCKVCDSIQQASYKERYKNNLIPETKKCRMCNKIKESSEFSLHSRRSDRLSSFCKECESLITAKRPNYVKEHKLILPPGYVKICSMCKETKSPDDFYKSSYNLDGLQYVCKDCEKREERKAYNRIKSQEIIEKHCKICGSLYLAARSSSERCENCRQHTIPEQMFITILDKYGIEFSTECRVNNLSIWCDFYLPDYNMFIDISPTVTHSIIGKIGLFEPKDKDYHISRRLQIDNEGYVYINIWDWDNPIHIIEAILNKTLKIKKQDTPNIFWCRHSLKSFNWGNYDKQAILLSNLPSSEEQEKQLLKEGWLPVYDDGQILLY